MLRKSVLCWCLVLSVGLVQGRPGILETLSNYAKGAVDKSVHLGEAGVGAARDAALSGIELGGALAEASTNMGKIASEMGASLGKKGAMGVASLAESTLKKAGDNLKYLPDFLKTPIQKGVEYGQKKLQEAKAAGASGKIHPDEEAKKVLEKVNEVVQDGADKVSDLVDEGAKMAEERLKQTQAMAYNAIDKGIQMIHQMLGSPKAN